MLGSHSVHATPDALADAVTAAAKLCPASAREISETAQLATDSQSAATGPILTCAANKTAFLHAVALPQPSGHPGDADNVPALVIQPAGDKAWLCRRDQPMPLHLTLILLLLCRSSGCCASCSVCCSAQPHNCSEGRRTFMGEML